MPTQFTRQTSRPLTATGIAQRAERMAAQCEALAAYAWAIDNSAPKDAEHARYLVERTTRRLCDAANDLKKRMEKS